MSACKSSAANPYLVKIHAICCHVKRETQLSVDSFPSADNFIPPLAAVCLLYWKLQEMKSISLCLNADQTHAIQIW